MPCTTLWCWCTCSVGVPDAVELRADLCPLATDLMTNRTAFLEHLRPCHQISLRLAEAVAPTRLKLLQALFHRGQPLRQFGEPLLQVGNLRLVQTHFDRA